MKVWAVANQKGGVGKTTTVISLAGLLARAGQRTLLVDLDPHGSLSAYLGLDPDTIEDSVFGLFERDAGQTRLPVASLLNRTPMDGVHLMPGSPALATVDRLAVGREGLGLALHRALTQLEGRYDAALLDCPPVFGVLMLNALAACSRLIIPVQTEPLALHGLKRMWHTLEMVERSQRRPIDRVVVPTMFDSRTRASRDSLARLRAEYAEAIWPGLIPIDTRLRDASDRGEPLTLEPPYTRAAAAYRELLGWLGEPVEVAGVQAEAAPEPVPARAEMRM